MGIWNWFRKKSKDTKPLVSKEESYLPGEFEFLITGVDDMTFAQFDLLIGTCSEPAVKQGHTGYYRIGDDEFWHSMEMPGIQMVFNEEAPFERAKAIAEAVVRRINEAGYPAELLTLDNSKIYRFD